MTLELLGVAISVVALFWTLTFIYLLKRIEIIEAGVRQQRIMTRLIERKLGTVLNSACKALGSLDDDLEAIHKAQGIQGQAIVELVDRINAKDPEGADEERG